MRFRHAFGVYVFAFVASAAIGHSQSTWTGAVSSSWNTTGNWDSGTVPGPGTDVVIAPAPNQPSSFILNPSCNSLTVQSGATLTLSGSFDLRVAGDLSLDGVLVATSSANDVEVVGSWTNNGTFASGTGRVELSGTGVLGGSATTVFHHLSITGGARTSSAAWQATGDVTVEAGATLDLGGFTHLVTGNWTSGEPGVSVEGAGWIELNGPGLMTTITNMVPNLRVSAGVRQFNFTTVSGEFEMTGGEVRVLDDQLLGVVGDASFSNGVLAWDGSFAGPDVVDINGDVTLTSVTVGAASADSLFRCGGDWSSDGSFAMGAGTVEFDGLSTATISAGSLPGVRVVNGAKSLTSALSVGADLVVESGASLTAAGSIDVAGSVGLGNALTTVDLGSWVHTVAGDWTSLGGSATGTSARIDFTGPGLLDTGAGSMPGARILAGTRTVSGTSVLAGDLAMSAGGLTLADDVTLSVGGDMTLTAGTLAFPAAGGPGYETIDVEGSVVLTATAGSMTAQSAIGCAGDWTSSAAWNPTEGSVSITGAGSTVSGAGTSFHDLTLAAAVVTIEDPIQVRGLLDLQAGAALVTNAALDLDGDVLLGNLTASWDMGAFTHTVNRSFTSLGAPVTGSGRIEFDGDGATTMSTQGGVLSNVLVSAGNRTLTGGGVSFFVNVSGALEMTGGRITMANNAFVHVGGDASLTAGTLAFDDTDATLNETLNVGGDVTLTCAAGAMQAGNQILCAGDWTSSSSWSPTAGVVDIDPAASATVSGASPAFATLRGRRRHGEPGLGRLGRREPGRRGQRDPGHGRGADGRRQRAARGCDEYLGPGLDDAPRHRHLVLRGRQRNQRDERRRHRVRRYRWPHDRGRDHRERPDLFR